MRSENITIVANKIHKCCMRFSCCTRPTATTSQYGARVFLASNVHCCALHTHANKAGRCQGRRLRVMLWPAQMHLATPHTDVAMRIKADVSRDIRLRKQMPTSDMPRQTTCVRRSKSNFASLFCYPFWFPVMLYVLPYFIELFSRV